MLTDKVIELARKLKALADRGIDGEKDNAVYQLDKLMKKYNFTLEDFEEEAIKANAFKVDKKLERLFRQIIYSVLADKFNMFQSKVRGYRVVDCTAVEAAEIHAKFDFYKAKYLKDLEEQEYIFFKAFTHKNKIYSDKKDEEEKESKPLTAAEKAELWKVFNIMNNIEKHNYNKQIGG